MNANFQDAELHLVMTDDRQADLPVEQPPRNSPTSAVCYTDLTGPYQHVVSAQAPPPPVYHAPASAAKLDGGALAQAQAHDDTDSTPRSEVPSVPDAATASLLKQMSRGDNEPSYFSPQPLRVYSSQLPRSATASKEPSPTASVNASSTSVNEPEPPSGESTARSTTPANLDTLDRPAFHHNLSSTSTASVATVRANSVDPTHPYTPHARLQRDGPVYPNQSYAALQFQQYHQPHPPQILRTRSSHPAHFSGYSVSHISTFGLTNEHRDIMESGSRTVGNSPASSPGLFSPTTPPLRPNYYAYDNNYSTPWLHHTHRQAPKETHVADVEFDPVSGRKLINQYEICDELGRGVHGKVKLGRNLQCQEPGHDNFVAIKIVDRYSKRRRLGKNTSHEDKIKREIAILKKARHPNIVSLLEVIDDPSRKKVYIVLEHVKLGEIKWRTEGAKEICLVEWRRFKRESEGVFDNESAALEDERILKLAQQKIERQQRRKARESRNRRRNGIDGEAAWSLELGGDSGDEGSEISSSLPSQYSSRRREDRPPSRLQHSDRKDADGSYEDNMETAFRSTTPISAPRTQDPLATELEGTMYGAYDTDLFRGRTPSIAGSNSSHFTDEDEVPEHFRHVPLMTIQAAREAFRDTVLGLEYLHYQGVIHRDIKPANLLQTDHHRIKISDFGVSYLGRQHSEPANGDQSESDFQDADEAIELAKTVGTPAFYAPELCRTEVDSESPPVTQQIDVWALGVTLYCLIYGRVPFHDHNTFALMRLITDSEPYIARYRLKAVAEPSRSRPSSHGRGFNMTSNRRAPHDLEYEEVDDYLQDLIRKLLVKDPRQRITIKEIKHHPWLTQGIDNFNSWVEETDPGRSFQGRRIEVSKDDVEQAVVPITLMDRTRSIVRKGVDLVHGLTKNLTRGGSRRRAQSTTTGDGTSISAHSSSSTISQDGRRPSLAGAASIFEALSRAREPEHPLSQSVTASPEAVEHTRFPGSRTASPAQSVESNEPYAPSAAPLRPFPPERAYSTTSTSTSIRTIRQSELTRLGRPVSPNPPTALPGTPTALDSPGGTNLGGIFGGVPRRIVNSVRSRERMLKPPREHTRTKSIDRLVLPEDDAHCNPSLAISTTLASGHVDQPDVPKEFSPTLARSVSPGLSDRHGNDLLERTSSRQSSVSSFSARLRGNWAAQNDLEVGPTLNASTSRPPSAAQEAIDENFTRAKEEFVRRRVREEALVRERPRSEMYQRPCSSLSHTACPPSPDDVSFFERQKVEDFLNQQHPSSLEDNSDDLPMSINNGQAGALNSSSSEDQFGSMSQSTSNPSIPSVASANSSIAAEECLQMNAGAFPNVAPAASGESIHINQFDVPTDDPAGYDGDHALESEDDEESDEDDFIMMGRKKPAQGRRSRSESISNAELARNNIRKEIITSRRRSARSGSNGTVKKVTPLGDSADDKTPEPQ